jgi:adenine phosphoribosyltransferase
LKGEKIMDLKSFIGTVPDFPKPGITFRDIMPLLYSPTGLSEVTGQIVKQWAGKADVICALDARGFCFGPLVAQKLWLPFVMVRKKGKLPGKVIRVKYSLEYREEDEIEINDGVISPGDRVLIIDDVLATGGTAAAACDLVEKARGIVAGCVFVIELDGLGGRSRLGARTIQSLVTYGEKD